MDEDRRLEGRDVEKGHEENPRDDSFNVCQLFPYELKDVSVPDEDGAEGKMQGFDAYAEAP